MLAKPPDVSRERCEQIGLLLTEHADTIVDRWEAIAVRELPNADPEYRREMRDELPQFVRALGRQLCEEAEAEACPTTEARKHGRQRWQVGWKLDEVIRDYLILRRVIVEFLKNGPLDELRIAETALLNELIDEAITAAAAAYVQYSEQQWAAASAGLEQKVAQRTGQLRKLSLDLVRAEQREREELARTLHDGLQQILTAAKMHLAVLEDKQSPESAAESEQELGAVRSLLNESIQMARSLSVELIPPVLFSGGLVAALKWLAEWMKEKHGLAVSVSAQDALPEPEVEQVRTFLFQVARELLFNVVKHSGVLRASVELCRKDERCIRLVVSDPGAGFSATVDELRERKEGWGLPIVCERVEALGGGIELGSGPEGGARVGVDVPVDPA